MSGGYSEVQNPLIFEAQALIAFSFLYMAFQFGMTILS